MNLNQQLAEYENKILSLRKELSELDISSAGENITELQKDKLNFLTVELRHLSTQVELMKKQLSTKPDVIQQTAAPTPVTADEASDAAAKAASPAPFLGMEFSEDNADQPIPEIPLPKDSDELLYTPHRSTQSKSTQQTSGPAPRYIRVDHPEESSQQVQWIPAPDSRHRVNESQRSAGKGTDFESIFGKSWMAIFASLLIFISIIMLSAVVIPFLTDYIKVGLMFTFSIGLTLISLFMLRKNRDSKFLTALMGCGMGTIFISLLVTYISFHMLNQFVLYGLIVLWCIGAIFLSKYNSILFEIIGQLGVFVALILGLTSCASPEGVTMIPMVCGFYVLTTYVFYRVNHKKPGFTGTISSIFILLDTFVFSIGQFSLLNYFKLLAKQQSLGDYSHFILMSVGFCSTYLLLYLLQEYLIVRKEIRWRSIPVYLITLTLLLGNEVLFHHLLYPDGGRQYFSVLFLILPLIVIFLELRPLEEEFDTWVKGANIIALLILSWYLTSSILAIPVVALLCVVGAYFTNSEFYSTFSAIFAVIFSIMALFNPEIVYVSVVAMFLMISCHFLLAGRIDNFLCKCSAIFMIYCFVPLLTHKVPEIANIMTHSQNTVITFLILAVITLALLFTPVTSNWDTGEKYTYEFFLTCVFWFLVMFQGLSALHAADGPLLTIVTILVAVALFAVRPYKSENYKGILDALFVGRLTLLLVVILNVLNATNVLFSIPMLMEAIFFIILGHFAGKKMYRIYGLVLSNFCIAKLILFDISYEQDIQRALGFFICGVLCFVISFIYTRVEKIAARREEERAMQAEE